MQSVTRSGDAVGVLRAVMRSRMPSVMRLVIRSVTRSRDAVFVAVGVALGEDDVRVGVGVAVVLSVLPLHGVPVLRSVLRYCASCIQKIQRLFLKVCLRICMMCCRHPSST